MIHDDVLCRKWENELGNSEQLQIVVPKSLVNVVLAELHDSPTGGHLGISKT